MTVRKRTAHTTVYVIEWPRHGIVKVGITQVERWQAFIGRGGRVVALLRFQHGHDYGPLTPAEWEQALLARFIHDGDYPEWKRGLSESLLGGTGGGYTECRQMSGHDALLHVEALLELHRPTWCRIEIGHAYAGCTCSTHQRFAEAEQNRREHALTEKAFQDPHDNTSSVTHTRAYRPRCDSQLFAHAPIRASSIQGATTSQLSHVIHRPDEHADATPNRRTP